MQVRGRQGAARVWAWTAEGLTSELACIALAACIPQASNQRRRPPRRRPAAIAAHDRPPCAPPACPLQPTSGGMRSRPRPAPPRGPSRQAPGTQAWPPRGCSPPAAQTAGCGRTGGGQADRDGRGDEVRWPRGCAGVRHSSVRHSSLGRARRRRGCSCRGCDCLQPMRLRGASWAPARTSSQSCCRPSPQRLS